ncbi:MAG: FecR protein [Verrucomicrobiota bacterium]
MLKKSVVSRIASLIAALSLPLCALANQQPATAVIQNLSGSATYTDSEGTIHPALQGTVLRAGDTLSTGTDSSADLLLPETGATVGLEADATLQFERLTYTDTPSGRITDTLLNLTSGELVSKVQKQKPGSRFLVQTDQATTEVRGTEFFVNAYTGDVHVTSGTVLVTLNILVDGKSRGRDDDDDDHGKDKDKDKGKDKDKNKGKDDSTLLTRTITVGAGQSLFIPKVLNKAHPLDELAAISTPWPYSPKLLKWLDKHSRCFDGYNFASSGTVQIQETFDARRLGNGNIWLVRPPKIEVISP